MERHYLEDPGIEGWITSKQISRNIMGDTEWTDLAQDSDMWQATANMVYVWV